MNYLKNCHNILVISNQIINYWEFVILINLKFCYFIQLYFAQIGETNFNSTIHTFQLSSKFFYSFIG